MSKRDCGVVLAKGLARESVVPDVLVYAAACGWVGPIMKETETTIRSSVATNFTGFALVAKHVVKAMLTAEDGGAGNQAQQPTGSPLLRTLPQTTTQRRGATRLVHEPILYLTNSGTLPDG